jgi:hypothetical protein
VYGKGALFLARLRELLGDEAFFALLQHHYEAHKYDLLNPDGFRQSLEQATGNAEALALYDAVVVRGEPIEGLAELEVLAGLDGLLEGKFSPEEMESLLGLAEQLGGFLDGEVAPEDLGELLGQLGVFLGGELAPGEMGDMMGLLEQLPGLLDGEVSPEELDDALQLLQELLEGL